MPNFQSLKTFDQLYRTAEDWLEALSKDADLADAALEAASHQTSADGDFHWPMVRALACWNLKKFEDGLSALLEVNTSSVTSSDFSVYLECSLDAFQVRRPGQKLPISDLWNLAGRSDIYYNLGNLFQKKSPERAVNYYLESLRLDPGAANVWHNYGAVLNETDKQAESLAALKNSLRLDPYDADAWCNLGLTYFQLEKFDSSKLCFVHSIGLDRSHAQSHVNYGQLLIETLQPEQALSYLRRGFDLDNSSSIHSGILALLYCCSAITKKVGVSMSLDSILAVWKPWIRLLLFLRNDVYHNCHLLGIPNLLFGASKVLVIVCNLSDIFGFWRPERFLIGF